MRANKEQYYQDGVTKVTDPFYMCVCPDGHKMWCCTYLKKCPECGKKLSICIPANLYKKETASKN